MRGPRSLRERLALGAVLVTAVGLGVVTLAFNLLLSSQLRSGADALLQSRAVAVAASLDIAADGSVQERRATLERRVDPGTWLYQGTRALERAPGDPDQQRVADGLAGTGERTLQTREPAAVRYYALPLRSGGRQVGTVVSSVPLDPYQRVADLALAGTALLAVLLLGGVWLLSRALLGRALSPVAAMTDQAARWSSTEVDRRFGDEPRPTELRALAATLDGVLDRLSAVLRHEQQLSAELSHELRTPLAAVVAEIELLSARPRSPEELAEGHAAVLRATRRMSGVLEALLTAARVGSTSAPGWCRVRDAVDAAVGALGDDADVEVCDRAPGAAAGVDSALLERALGPLLDNALRHRSQLVQVETGRGPTGPWVAVQDDGPGVPAALTATLWDAGVQGGDSCGSAGLGLALARRLARAGGGDLLLEPSARGARFVIHLPPA